MHVSSYDFQHTGDAFQGGTRDGWAMMMLKWNGISWECQYHEEAVSARNNVPIFVACTPECSQ